MKKIIKWFLGFCLVMVILSMAVVGALIAGIAFLSYKAYQEYKVNKFSNKFKAECAGIIVISLVLIGLCSGNTDTTNTTETSAVKQEETVKEEKTNKEDKTIEDCAKEVFGDDFEQMTTNENMITVEIYVDTFWSTDSLSKSYKFDTLSFFKKIKDNDELKDYDSVRIICRAAGTDKYGNDEKILALSSTYSTEDIKKINFENMTGEILYDNFDQQKFVHPAMNN